MKSELVIDVVEGLGRVQTPPLNEGRKVAKKHGQGVGGSASKDAPANLPTIKERARDAISTTDRERTEGRGDRAVATSDNLYRKESRREARRCGSQKKQKEKGTRRFR